MRPHRWIPFVNSKILLNDAIEAARKGQVYDLLIIGGVVFLVAPVAARIASIPPDPSTHYPIGLNRQHLGRG